MCWPALASKWYGLGGKVTPNGPTVGPSSSSIVVENYCNYLCHLGTKETSNVGACSRRLWLTRVSPHCSVSLTQVFLHVIFLSSLLAFRSPWSSYATFLAVGNTTRISQKPFKSAIEGADASRSEPQ